MKKESSFASLTTGLIILAAAFILFCNIPDGSSETNSTFQANVTVANSAPTVGPVNISTVALAASSDLNNVSCAAVVYDLNGYQDITAVTATFFFNISTVGDGSADDTNSHYSIANGPCMKVDQSGNQLTVNCSTFIHHEAFNGTWVCNISATDGTDTGINSSGTTIEPLIAMTINETGIDYGAIAVGASSTASRGINITNQGNMNLLFQVNGSVMNCTTRGTIPVNNTRYNFTASDWATMSNNLTDTATTVGGTALGIQGNATVDALNATDELFWTVMVPYGVEGVCNNNVTITAIQE